MSTDKYTIEQVADVVESEGLGYAVMDYLGPDSIDDPQLAALWQTAKSALDAIDAILETVTAADGDAPEDGF